MAVEATAAQLAALRDGDPAERIALLRLPRARNAETYARWLAALGAASAAAGGKRVYRGRVDQVVLGEGVRADELIIDVFPSRELAAESLRSANPHAGAALAELLVLAARPRELPRLALLVAGVLARLRASRERVGLPPDRGLRAIDPRPEAFSAFLAAEPERPLDVLNLNQHQDRAAYARYGKNTITQLVRRRAGPIFVAHGVSVVAASEAHPFAASWDEILLVRYPRRGAMLDMLSDPLYQRGLPHREAGLARAGLVALCPLPPARGHSG